MTWHAMRPASPSGKREIQLNEISAQSFGYEGRRTSCTLPH